MKNSNLSFVPLSQASLCLDCEMITAAAKSCTTCGSAALLNIARALSRPNYHRLLFADDGAMEIVSAEYSGGRQTFFPQQERPRAESYEFSRIQGE